MFQPKLEVRAGRLKAGDPGSNAMEQGQKQQQQQQSSDKCSSPPKNCEGCGFRRGFPLGTGTPHQKTSAPTGQPVRGCDLHMLHFPSGDKISKQQLFHLEPIRCCIVGASSNFWHFFVFLDKLCMCGSPMEAGWCVGAPACWWTPASPRQDGGLVAALLVGLV